MLMLNITNISKSMVSVLLVPGTTAITLNPQDSVQLNLVKLRKDWQTILKSMTSLAFEVVDSSSAKNVVEAPAIVTPAPAPSVEQNKKAQKKEVVNEIVKPEPEIKNVSEVYPVDKKR